MSQKFSVQDAIRQSATDMEIDELSRRGLRKVKVLDKETVFRLIDEAVERVVEERLELATAHERQQMQQEARQEFQRLVRERHERVQQQVDERVEAEVEEYQQRIAELENQVLQGNIPGAASVDPETLGALIRDAVAQAQSQQSNTGNEEIAALQKSIEGLAKSVGTGGGSRSQQPVDAPSEEALQAFFSRNTEGDVESNISNVEVKNAKADGVHQNLAKLRSLKKGSE